MRQVGSGQKDATGLYHALSLLETSRQFAPAATRNNMMLSPEAFSVKSPAADKLPVPSFMVGSLADAAELMITISPAAPPLIVSRSSVAAAPSVSNVIERTRAVPVNVIAPVAIVCATTITPS